MASWVISSPLALLISLSVGYLLFFLMTRTIYITLEWIRIFAYVDGSLVLVPRIGIPIQNTSDYVAQYGS